MIDIFESRRKKHKYKRKYINVNLSNIYSVDEVLKKIKLQSMKPKNKLKVRFFNI